MGDQRDQPTRMGERGSQRDPTAFQVPLDGSLPSVRSAYDGYAARKSDGLLERFFKGRFLKMVLYATSASTSTGALGWTPRGTQGLFQDALNKVFSVREEVRSTSRCCRRPFAFKGSVNSTQPASSEKQVSRDGKGSEVEVHQSHHYTFAALPPVCQGSTSESACGLVSWSQ